MRAAVPAHRITGAILLAALTLAACSDKGAPTESAPTTIAVPKRPVDGGTLRLGIGGPVQPDPAAGNLASPTELMLLDVLHDGLTRLGADGVAEPALALGWSADPTLTSWTFRLDPDATFSDGRTIAGADVVASLERVAKAGDRSLPARPLETVTGFRAFADGSVPHLAGLASPDPLTVTIGLDSPLSVLPVVVASPVLGIVDVPSLDAAVTTPSKLEDLGLSGGWVVRSVRGPVVTLDRRRGAPGHLDALEVRAYLGPDSAYEAFGRGHVDWALVPSDRHAAALVEHGAEAFAPFQAELFFGMRVRGPLANAALRRAISSAIDRKAIVAKVYRDLADPLGTILPAGVPGHDADQCGDCGYNPARARELLAAAFPDGQVPTIRIDYDQAPAQEAMVALLAAELAAVGIPTELRGKPLAEYQAFIASGAQELFSFGWIGGYRSPDAYLAPLFGSAANDNLTGYASGPVDAAIAAARATLDPAAAALQWSEAERQVLSDVVVLPIAQFRTQAVVSVRVRALTPRVDGTTDWSAVWLTDGK